VTQLERRVGVAAALAALSSFLAAVGELVHEQPEEGEFSSAADYVEELLFLAMCVAAAAALVLFARTVRARGRAGAYLAAGGFGILAAATVVVMAVGHHEGPDFMAYLVGLIVVAVGLGMLTGAAMQGNVRPRGVPPALLVSALLSIPLVEYGGPALLGLAWLWLAASALGRRGLPPES
jgi:hypothetical protein